MGVACLEGQAGTLRSASTPFPVRVFGSDTWEGVTP